MGGGEVVAEDDGNQDGFGDFDWKQLEGLGESLDAEEGTANFLISPEMLAKRLLWDVTPCSLAEQVRDYLGYSPASEDVEEMEHRESHQRLVQASAAAPFVEAMSKHAAKAIVGAMIVSSGDTPPDAVRQETTDKLEPVIFQACFSILAELIDVQILHFAHFGFLVADDEEEE